jgi:hypothetical protein
MPGKGTQDSNLHHAVNISGDGVQVSDIAIAVETLGVEECRRGLNVKDVTVHQPAPCKKTQGVGHPRLRTFRKSNRASLAAGESPRLRAAVESHPNVEKHDVRMGHPARNGPPPFTSSILHP